MRLRNKCQLRNKCEPELGELLFVFIRDERNAFPSCRASPPHYWHTAVTELFCNGKAVLPGKRLHHTIYTLPWRNSATEKQWLFRRERNKRQHRKMETNKHE
jgi:hypothetical protein